MGGASFLFLPTYSPDLNPPNLTLIEMTFSKLKALMVTPPRAHMTTYGKPWGRSVISSPMKHATTTSKRRGMREVRLKMLSPPQTTCAR